MKTRITLALYLALSATTILSASAQKRNDDLHRYDETVKVFNRDIIRIPSVDGLQAIKCDFHMHTIFSDGEVLPATRVKEAWADGLDAISVTDHIEYRRNTSYVLGDHNKPYADAAAAAAGGDVIVIHGSELTRKKTFGHMNAIFIQDANKLDIEDPIKAVEEANAQGGFVFMNHPGFPNDTSTLYPMHVELIQRGLIQGVEVFNGVTFCYYPKASEWAKEYNLATISNSDIHAPIHTFLAAEKMSRPMTIVFASERSEQGIHEGLTARRTVGWGNGKLFGSAEWVEKLVRASLQVEPLNDAGSRVKITNDTDLPFEMTYGENYIVIPANNIITANFPADGVVQMRNCLVGLNEALTINWKE